jgi:hypothetical protein
MRYNLLFFSAVALWIGGGSMLTILLLKGACR